MATVKARVRLGAESRSDVRRTWEVFVDLPSGPHGREVLRESPYPCGTVERLADAPGDNSGFRAFYHRRNGTLFLGRHGTANEAAQAILRAALDPNIY